MHLFCHYGVKAAILEYYIPMMTRATDDWGCSMGQYCIHWSTWKGWLTEHSSWCIVTSKAGLAHTRAISRISIAFKISLTVVDLSSIVTRRGLGEDSDLLPSKLKRLTHCRWRELLLLLYVVKAVSKCSDHWFTESRGYQGSCGSGKETSSPSMAAKCVNRWRLKRVEDYVKSFLKVSTVVSSYVW